MLKKYSKQIDWHKYFARTTLINYLLVPLSWLYIFCATILKIYYKKIYYKNKFKVPIIIVGNLTVGGGGKTPLVIAIVNYLKTKYKIAIVTRGYARVNNLTKTVFVNNSTKVAYSGDEALLIAQNTNVIVAVNNDRNIAINDVLKKYSVELIICDDGLQNYKIHRDIEILTLAKELPFGNNFFLPAGPLRESLSRLREVDYIICQKQTKPYLAKVKNSVVYQKKIIAKYLINVATGEKIHYTKCQFKNCIAISAIANNNSFYNILKKWGLNFVAKSFMDHHNYTEDDFLDYLGQNIIITQKDYVKCKQLNIDKSQIWYLPIECKLDDNFLLNLCNKLDGFQDN